MGCCRCSAPGWPAPPSWSSPGLARLLADRLGGDNGAIFETAILDQRLRWSSWQTDPPRINFYRTHGGREVDIGLHSPRRLLGLEVKARKKAHPGDARPLADLLEAVRVPGIHRNAQRLGLVVTRGREVEPLARHIRAIPDWRLFGPPE